MPKQSQRVGYNTFSKGLLTEFSQLNYPPDSAQQFVNYELNRDGTIDRRLGMGYEEGFTYRDSGDSVGQPVSALRTFRWISVAGDADNEFLVVQHLNRLQFFDLNVDPISSAMLGVVFLALPGNNLYSFASIEGRLVVASGNDIIAAVEYSPTPKTFAVSYIRLLTRDLWGIEEVTDSQYESDPSYRGVTNGSDHRYNLHNQSWGIPRKSKDNILVDPAENYFVALSKYPSNSEEVWAGLQFQAVASGQDPFERQYTNLYEEVIGASVSSAKGYFIIDLLNRGQSRVDQYYANRNKYPALAALPISAPVDLTKGGAKCVASFAGRVFYSGFNGETQGGDKRSPDLSSFVVFSQIVKSLPDIAKCYQDGDPTSRDTSDIVDADGGFIKVSGAKGIVSLVNIESHLLVIATNGVWAISGGSDFGFSATNYKVNKISTFGGLSETSVIVEGGRCYYWSEDGIYVVGKNQFADLEVNSMTRPTIQKFYENIPNASKRDAIGEYDQLDKKIRWIYKTGTPFTSTSVTSELVFDSLLNAFSYNTISNVPTNNVEVFSLFRGSAFRRADITDDVLVDSDLVLSNTDQVILNSTIRDSGIQSMRYLILANNGTATYKETFALYNNADFEDWTEFNGVGVDAKAYCLTGTVTGGDSAIEKQAPYLVFHMRRTESGTDAEGLPLDQSSCKVRIQWDFSNKGNSNKWTSLFQAYRYTKTYIPLFEVDSYDTGFELITTKNKIRGRGKALAIYFETEPLKDCRIVGWSLTVNANQIT